VNVHAICGECATTSAVDVRCRGDGAERDDLHAIDAPMRRRERRLAVLAPSSVEEPPPPRHRRDACSMA
jgi:hypothetical protein